MLETFYIGTDEEIISVIGRLRKSAAEENIFVFPKRALVLQSVVNLRLLQREAQKLKKKIIIVSQDEIGRMLAEKIGIPTENYSEDLFKQESHLELVPEKNMAEKVVLAREVDENMLNAEAIGSADFHAAPVPQKQATKLRVRNMSPPKLTSLNSKRFEENAETHSPDRGERLKNFYSNSRVPLAEPAPARETKEPVMSISGKKAGRIFLILGAVSLFSLIGVLLFLFLPKAEVEVTPYKMTQPVDVELDEQAASARVLEKDEAISLTFATTGKSAGVNQKARGTVIIYNNYSADPQPLVATTRMETADGKLFRLVSGVTVPGLTTKNGQKEAGAIEAEVIADQAGEEYNIGPSDFRIPGFKGSPKYDGFSAKSVKSMTGGGSAGAADVPIVAKVDLETAEREAKEKAKEEFLNEARGELGPDEKILEEQMDITSSVSSAAPQIGTAATAFEYKNTFKVRAFVFSEKNVREKLEAATEKNIRGIKFKPLSYNITYEESAPDFSEGKLRLIARALVTLESEIDQDALKTALLGKNKADLQKVIDSFPAVKKINVVFSPEILTASIPGNKNRVNIVIKPAEEF